jgi:phospholipase/carboxylesterase
MAYPDLSWQTFRPAEGFYLSEVEEPRRLPVRTFLPTGYEPRYPYPLVVFFHGQGGNEEQVLHLAPRLSRRNYICISLRGPQELGVREDGRLGYSWGTPGNTNSLIEDYVLRAVELTRRSYHVHSERIHLAGINDGATLAYSLGLAFPEKFGGVISLNGAMPRHCASCGCSSATALPTPRCRSPWRGRTTACSTSPASTSRCTPTPPRTVCTPTCSAISIAG